MDSGAHFPLRDYFKYLIIFMGLDLGFNKRNSALERV